MNESLNKAINSLYDQPLTPEEATAAGNNLIAFMQELISIDLKLKEKEKKKKC